MVITLKIMYNKNGIYHCVCTRAKGLFDTVVNIMKVS